MRVLFLTGGSPATVFALSPLATAATLNGHDVLVASNRAMTSFVASVGLPPVSITDGGMLDFMFADRDGTKLALPSDPKQRIHFNGRGFGRLAAASLPGLRELVGHWRPDLIVGGSLCYAAGLIAHETGIPFVRHTWDLGEPAGMDDGAVEELSNELAYLGLSRLPVPDLWVDICPPSLRAAGLGARQDMRFVPFNQQRTIDPWMYRRTDRPRVCITAGSRVSDRAEVEYLAGLVAGLDSLNAELVIAAPEAVAADLRTTAPQAHIGWFPLDRLLDTCDLLIHHGGGQSCLNALNAGVPQLLSPTIPKMIEPCTRISDYGAAITLVGDEQTPTKLAEATSVILAAPSFRERAREVRKEIAAQPTPGAVVSVLEELVGRR